MAELRFHFHHTDDNPAEDGDTFFRILGSGTSQKLHCAFNTILHQPAHPSLPHHAATFLDLGIGLDKHCGAGKVNLLNQPINTQNGGKQSQIQPMLYERFTLFSCILHLPALQRAGKKKLSLGSSVEWTSKYSASLQLIVAAKLKLDQAILSNTRQ